MNRLFQPILNDIHRLDYAHNPYLEIEQETVFSDDQLLQFSWQGNRLVWQRTVRLKYDYSPYWQAWKGERPQRIILPENRVEYWFYRAVGEVQTSEFAAMVQALQGLEWASCYGNRGMGRDGERWTLRMGESETFSELSLSWWTCAPPDHWPEIKPILQQLLCFADELQADDISFLHVTQEWEDTETGRSVWTNIEEMEAG